MNNVDDEQLKYWFMNSLNCVADYKEPKLEEETVNIIKLVCSKLKQNEEIFIVSIEVIEDYIRLKKLKNVCSENSLLIIGSAILLTSKFFGSTTEVKISSIQSIFFNLLKQKIEDAAVKRCELQILTTIKKLPLTTVVTDVNILIKYYVKYLKIGVNLQPFIKELYYIFYLCRKEIFFKLKMTYIKINKLNLFQSLLSNKLYIPCGIILCSLKMTKFKNNEELRKITIGIGQTVSISSCHLLLLQNEICRFLI